MLSTITWIRKDYDLHWNVLLVVVMLGGLLVACNTGGDELPMMTTTSDERITIRFAVWEWQREAYKDVIEAFEEANPGLHVQLVSFEETVGLGPKPDRAIRLLSAADVTEMWISPSGTTVKKSLIRDLTPFIEADPNFRPDDFYPLVV